MVYFPILGALALASGTIMSKLALTKKKINVKLFHTSAFLGAVITMIPLLYFFWRLDSQAFELKNILIFALMILFSMFANFALFYSMKKEKVSNIEPAIVLEPIFVILLAIIFSYIFGEALFERNLKIIIPALIAGSALVFSHIKKHHIIFSKYFLLALIASFLFALELVTTKLILDYYSPISFYFLRCLIIFLISFAIFKPKLTKLNKKTSLQIFLIGALWVLYRIIVYYGYIQLGVIFTTLLLMLAPVFVFFFAWKFLKEKISWKNILATAIIVGCVLYGVLN
ncbi:MAG: DMT family transporter [archaeon]